MVNGDNSVAYKKSELESDMNMAERLLDAWLQVSAVIRNAKFVKELTYNESIICKLLLDDAEAGGEGLTATDLCRATQIKKSQMNRTLASMEESGLIVRSASAKDHRKQLVRIEPSQMSRFEIQHARIITFVNAVMEELGHARSLELMSALKELAFAVRKVKSSAPTI